MNGSLALIFVAGAAPFHFLSLCFLFLFFFLKCVLR
jgi:hypothetical protein